MSFFRNSTSPTFTEATSTLVHRLTADVSGAREVVDELTRLTVTAFPMAMAREIIPARAMMTAAYVLSDGQRIYCGESTRIGRRIWDHANDPTKSFAREVFVITRHTMEPLDKPTAIYMQAHLTRKAEEAGAVTVQRGTGPQVLDVNAMRGALYLQMSTIAERLLFDAGCTAFHAFGDAKPTSMAREAVDSPPPPAEIVDEATPIEIGVAATPGDAEEYQLAYSDLWGRGYDADGGFVVTAGSEVRREVNPSVNQMLHTRRRELEAARVLADIEGREDRQRLLVAVWFPSRAIAAKVVTGAHVGAAKWVAVGNPRPFVLAA
jgi:predicted GIY-YIG superfamily endonuclease